MLHVFPSQSNVVLFLSLEPATLSLSLPLASKSEFFSLPLLIPIFCVYIFTHISPKGKIICLADNWSCLCIVTELLSCII
ncbi:hypothetical protein K7X08_035386 [Anisodus acutangulus]|uniref:Uncharacterized protein n=1 Tax=Anisodus acutangulus TaxID=402998 RepID=A0A9Q1R0K3_9SOLA|nr:hypothetical protein K7X08_035386 [Anisodus acutangulus]